MIVGDTARNPGPLGHPDGGAQPRGGVRRDGARRCGSVVWHPDAATPAPAAAGMVARPGRGTVARPAGLARVAAPAAGGVAVVAARGRARANSSRCTVIRCTAARRRARGCCCPNCSTATARARQLVDYVHRRGWRLAVIFHDAIPVQHPEFVPPELPALHAEYMRALSRADLILPNSEASAEGWREFMRQGKISRSPAGAHLHAGLRPARHPARADAAGRRHARPDAPVRMLCVSTLEPRKNHRALLAAYELAVARRARSAPGTRSRRRVLRRRAGHRRRCARGRWRASRVCAGTKKSSTAGCTSFTRSAISRCIRRVLEGFGLPVIESLWFGRPCVCANFGVMAENAAGGGCLTADVRDPQALADAMLALAGFAGTPPRAGARSDRAQAQDLGRIRQGSALRCMDEMPAPRA